MLRLRKAAGHDGLVNEHIIYGGPNLTVHISLLFTALLRHSYVPKSFQFGIIKPIPKNKHGDLTNIDMYRGITLTPVISKLFESLLVSVYGDWLGSDHLQFGFKKGSSCSHALFSFTESVRHFNKRGSKMYGAFLDASKAFDKVLINGLLTKLIKRNVPILLIRILYVWFDNLHCSVVWNSMIGMPFAVKCGVRQGGVLSPFLFAIYMNDLIDMLRCSGYGLHIGMIFTGTILYADDIALLACSCLSLQKLIDICVRYGIEWDIRFNPLKTQIACFGGKPPNHDTIVINGQLLSWYDRIKYLSCFFKSRNCEADPASFVARFYGAFNNILNVMGNSKSRDEMVAVHLIKASITVIWL